MKLFRLLKSEKNAAPAAISLESFFDEHYYPHAEVSKVDPRDDMSTFNTQMRESLGHLTLPELTNQVLDKWVRDRVVAGYKRSTINKYIFLMNRIMNLGRAWGHIQHFNPNQQPIKPLSIGDYKQRFLSEEEIERLFEACQKSTHPFLYLFIRLLILTGARKGEALKMRWCDVDFDKRVWTVPKSKNGRSRRIILSEAAIEVLFATRDKAKFLDLDIGPNCPVFTNPKTKTHYDSFCASWHIVREWAGLDDVRIHDLRHTFASLLVNKGVSLYEVQTLLGHSSVNMTQRYAHLAPDRLHRRAEIVSTIVERSSKGTASYMRANKGPAIQ